MIFPQVKKIKEYDDLLQFDKLGYDESECSKFAINFLSKFIGGLIFEKDISPKLNFILNEKLREEEYKIVVDSNISVYYSDELGIRNAMSTFFQLIEKNGKTYKVKKCEIIDYPDCEYRSVLLDMGRGVCSYERLKEDILRFALLKCRYLHFNVMDKFGMAYETTAFKNEKIMNGTVIYTKKQIKDLVSYCESLKIEVIPGIEVPSHGQAFVKNNQEIMCKGNFENRSYAVVCAGKQKTYNFYKKIISEICSLFKSKYIHIGGDELYFENNPRLNWLCYWDECEDCKKLMKKEGLKDKYELYFYVIKKIYEIVKHHNKTMIMWNDELDINRKDFDLPKDVIIEYWNVHNDDKKRYSGKPFLYKNLLKMDYKIINSWYAETYVDLEEYANPKTIQNFSPYTCQNKLKRKKKLIWGSDASVWEYGNEKDYPHYKITVFPSTALLLGRFWSANKKEKYNNDYNKALTKIFFGLETPVDFDMFLPFGSIMPPRKKDTYTYLTNLELQKINFIEYLKIVKKLKNKTYSKIYSKYLEKYVKIIEKLSNE